VFIPTGNIFCDYTSCADVPGGEGCMYAAAAGGGYTAFNPLFNAAFCAGFGGTACVNTCTCLNGIAATSCPEYNAIMCASCSTGYYKNGDLCTGCRSACGVGTSETTACSSSANRVCTVDLVEATNVTALQDAYKH
jgi:hypothetical protein